jgi:hypothetical protein
MGEAKVRLSQKEMELITNADWILTKNAVLQKVNKLLGRLQEKQRLYLSSLAIPLPEQIFQMSPKISKGENYKGLPYQILDYPRLFDPENICAIRTMFWWGHFFSSTLHLAGVSLNSHQKKLIASFDDLAKSECYYCGNDEQWEHHFEESNYQPLSAISSGDFERLIKEKSFMKLAFKTPLAQWENAEETLLGFFKKLIGILAD